MRIVITGASGNIGTALLRRLASTAPDAELVGVARRTPVTGSPYQRVQWHSVDLSADDAASQLAPVFAGADVVVHLAWGFQPSRDTDYLRRLGVGGSTAVLRAAEQAGVPHLVHMSSVGAYSRNPGVRVDETAARDGIPSSPYSQHKAAAERMLDQFEATGATTPIITRVRPGFVVQRSAGSAFLRYGLPGYVPPRALGLLPVLPLDRSLAIPVIHADDVASALTAIIDAQAPGAFNLAGEPEVTRDDVAAALTARPVHVPAIVLRELLNVTWHLRLQALDPGWLDLAFSVPLLDTERARAELGWAPAVDARHALADVIDGMQHTAGTSSPVLRRRSLVGQIRKAWTQGPIGNRRLP